MSEGSQTQRVVFRGLDGDVSQSVVGERLASKLSATPQQVSSILASPGYVIAKGLTPEEAANYVAVLGSCGARAQAQDEAALLRIDLPEANQLVAVATADPAETLIRRITDYERGSSVFWIGLGIIQIFTIFGAIAGIWNIANGIAGFKLARRIRARDVTIPADYEPIGWYIVMGLINLFLGGVIGVAFIAFDLFVRDKILTNRALFDKVIPKIDAYAKKKARREERFKRLHG